MTTDDQTTDTAISAAIADAMAGYRGQWQEISQRQAAPRLNLGDVVKPNGPNTHAMTVIEINPKTGRLTLSCELVNGETVIEEFDPTDVVKVRLSV